MANVAAGIVNIGQALQLWRLQEKQRAQEKWLSLKGGRDSEQDQRLTTIEYQNACLSAQLAGVLQLLLEKNVLTAVEIDQLHAALPAAPNTDWPVIDDTEEKEE